jgi:serine/threonine protein kinase
VNALEGGSSVGRYRILNFLGAGAMGEVYVAEDPQIDRRLAIKTVRLVGRPQEIEDRKRRLLREARAAGRLLHPHIVTLFDAGEAEGLLYLVFELVEGMDLSARLDRGAERLSLREVLRVARQTAEALDYAHGQGIVHRDIKPSNILLDRAGRVKVADFGIAKMAGQSTELTMAGSVMGSPQYLSPEQIKGEDLDGRSDLFSLGVVLYEILSGKRPFEGDTITTLVYQILHKEPPPISELRAVPPRLEALLRRLLAKDREDRMATAGEAARELALIEAELSDETLSAPAGSEAALDETFVLPPRGSSAATFVPPPPTRSTVAASPATTPSVPPVPQPAPPPLPAPAISRSRGPLIGAIAVAALLMMAVAAGGAWFAWSHWLKPRLSPAPGTASNTASQTAAATPEDTAEPTRVAQAPMPTSSRAGIAGLEAKPAVSPPPLAQAPTQPTPGAEPRVRPEPPAVAGGQQVQPPAPSPQPAVPAPAPAPAEESDPEPSAPSPAADRNLRTGLDVAFRVTPPDAYVLVEGRVIGTAQEWSGQKGGRPYSFPGPGTYLVKIKKDGMNDLRIAVEANAAGGITPIFAQLRQRPAEQVDSSDLRTFRVRSAIAFRVRPPLATVLVDGQPVGPARSFSGGFLHSREWLELPAGRHRVSLVAPGFRRQDLLVEVTPTAESDRERIEVVLQEGGDE